MVVFLVSAAVGGAIALRSWNEGRPARLAAEAQAATAGGDLPRALAAWHDWNETGRQTVATLLIEAQLAQTLDRGRVADRIAGRVLDVDPSAVAAWTIRLNRLRVLDRPAEAIALGLEALGRLRAPAARRAVLQATTLAALAEVPDAEARGQLDRWIAADPLDLDARVARLARIAAAPHPGDPDRATRIAELDRIVAADPTGDAAREALVVALADAGEVDRGRAVLLAWPEADRGPRFDRLQARWDLEYDHQPARAAAGFRRALLATPHDWKSHYGLARALRMTGAGDAAAAEALAVARLRERLDPATLGPRLAGDLDRLDADPAGAARDLAELCRGVGLAPLAAAWSQVPEPDRPPSTP